MKNKTTIISLLCLSIIVFIFFNKFFLKGLIPIPSDVPTGMYYPWINHNYGYPVRVPVKNPLITDSISQFWIWRNWGVDNLKIGKIAFWNPYSLAGYSMSPWFHTMIFSPSNLFYFFLNQTTAMALIVILQTIISLMGMYFLIKKNTSSNLSAIFGSISFSFSSFFVGWLTWGTISQTLAFLPLIILSLQQVLSLNAKPRHYLQLFCFTILSFLGGHPQTFFYVLLIIGLFIFSYLLVYKNFTKIIKPLIVFAFCFITTTFITFPSLEILKNSIRESENYIIANNFGFIPFGKLLITLVAPDFFGNPTTNNYWGGDFNYQEKLVWFGTSALILIIFNFLIQKKNKTKINHFNLFLCVTFATGILLSIKYPIGFLIYKLQIPLLSTSSAGRSIILSIFSGSILSSFSITSLIKSSKKYLRPFYWTSLAIGLFFSINISLIFILKSIFKDFLPQNFIINLNIGFRNLFFPFIFSILTLLFIFLIIKIQKKTRYFIVGIILILLSETLMYGWKYTPFTDPKLFFPKTESLEFLEEKNNESNQPFRIDRDKSELLPPNMWQAYHFYAVSGYDPITPKNFSNHLSQENIIQNPTRYVEFNSKNLDYLSSLGVKYFITLKHNLDNKIDKDGQISQEINSKKWKNIFEEGPVVILENQEFHPLYYLSKTDLIQPVLLSKTEDSWEFKVNLTKDNQLILLENTDSNWHVTVNNQPQSIIPYQQTFKSVLLKKGENIVRFNYQNKTFIKYLKVSVLGLIIGWIILTIVFIKFKKNHS